MKPLNAWASERAGLATKPADALLVARQVSKRFGGLQALDGVSLDIGHGEIYGLIGPNGAGKTTFFDLLTGFQDGYHGEFLFCGRKLPAGNPQRIVACGIARTFQHIRLFRELSVLENILIGGQLHERVGIVDALLRSRRAREHEQRSREDALALLDFVGIADQAARMAHTLPYGDQRRVEIARALACRPRLLALDEPAAGMNRAETLALHGLLERIRALGITVLLIEHDIRLVMAACDRIAVLDCGRLIAQGRPATVRTDETVIRAYLGRSRHDS